MDSGNLSHENADVDKSLFDAEQFLSNYTSMREECDRLKTENHQYQMRIQQLSQDLNQATIDKQNLERHIQKETLRNKELVWNLKLEIQKSQEDRLAWKEKYLDLCIKASQDKSKDAGFVKDAAGELTKEREEKRSKKNKRKLVRKKLTTLESLKQETSASKEKQQNGETQEINQPEQVAPTLEQLPSMETEPSQPEVLVDQPAVQSGNNMVEQHVNPSSNDMPERRPLPQQVEPLSLTTTIADETSNMPTADMVTSLDANLNSSATLTSNHVVTTDTADYYGLQAAPFDLSSQPEPVSGTTTFILQTSDATFCATAVLDNQQRNNFNNGTFNIKSDNSYNGNPNFSSTLNDSGSDSDENTEFNYRCNLCNFTYSDQEGLQKHLKAKHAAKNCFCKHCGKAYSTKSSLAQHIHHYHRHPMAYTCDICDKKFNRKDFLIKHQKTHSDDRTFQCGHCEKQFKTSASLSAHVNGAHNDARRFVCDFCGMRTSWRLSHLEHMKLHTGEPRKTRRSRKQQLNSQQQQTTVELDHQLQQQQQQQTQPQQLQQNQSLQHSELQPIQTQELSQLVVQPTQATVVQFITAADA